MSAQSPLRGWSDRLVAFINRHGVLVALAVGVVVLVTRLGSSGLWEPWEMDRADLARTLASPPEAVAALNKDVGPNGGRVASPTEVALHTVAQTEGVLVKSPEADTPSALRATLDELARSGRLRDVNPTVATFSLFGTLLWLPRWFRPDGRLTNEQVIASMTDIACGGLLVGGAKT